MVNLQAYRSSLSAYARWLQEHNLSAGQQWSNRLTNSEVAQVEGAVAEAVAWDFVACRVEHITLADDSGPNRTPDFLCCVGDNSFYVEVTNISSDKVTQVTGLDSNPRGPSYYNPMNSQVKRELIDKSSQLSGLEEPVALFVTTLHFSASALCVSRTLMEWLLHSTPKLSLAWNAETGDAIGEPHEVVKFEDAAFTYKESIESARRHVSALIVGGFGFYPPDRNVLGIIHPEAVRPFEPKWLVDVPMCSFQEWPPRDGKPLAIRWAG